MTSLCSAGPRVRFCRIRRCMVCFLAFPRSSMVLAMGRRQKVSPLSYGCPWASERSRLATDLVAGHGTSR